MAKDLSDTVRDMLGDIVNEAGKSIGNATSDKQTMAGARGLAAGAGLAALAPLAKKGFDAVRSNGVPSMPSPKPAKLAGKAASKVGDKVGGKLKEGISDKVDEAGGAGGIAKQAAGSLLPGAAAATAVAERKAWRELERAGVCRCSRRSTWRCPSRLPTTSGPSSRNGRTSCSG